MTQEVLLLSLLKKMATTTCATITIIKTLSHPIVLPNDILYLIKMFFIMKSLSTSKIRLYHPNLISTSNARGYQFEVAPSISGGINPSIVYDHIENKLYGFFAGCNYPSLDEGWEGALKFPDNVLQSMHVLDLSMDKPDNKYMSLR